MPKLAEIDIHKVICISLHVEFFLFLAKKWERMAPAPPLPLFPPVDMVPNLFTYLLLAHCLLLSTSQASVQLPMCYGSKAKSAAKLMRGECVDYGCDNEDILRDNKKVDS